MTGDSSAVHIMAVLLPGQKVQGVSFQVHTCQSAPQGWVCAVQKKKTCLNPLCALNTLISSCRNTSQLRCVTLLHICKERRE